MGGTQSTVLVVEDEPELADLFTAWLSPIYDVRTAYSGEEALALFDSAVDAVLLDRNLPDMSGDEILGELRSQTDTPVAFVSGVEPTVEILTLPVDTYREKPVLKDALEATVEDLLYRGTLDDVSRTTLALKDKAELLGSSLPELIPKLDAPMFDGVETIDQFNRTIRTIFLTTDD